MVPLRRNAPSGHIISKKTTHSCSTLRASPQTISIDNHLGSLFHTCLLPSNCLLGIMMFDLNLPFFRQSCQKSWRFLLGSHPFQPPRPSHHLCVCWHRRHRWTHCRVISLRLGFLGGRALGGRALRLRLGGRRLGRRRLGWRRLGWRRLGRRALRLGLGLGLGLGLILLLTTSSTPNVSLVAVVLALLLLALAVALAAAFVGFLEAAHVHGSAAMGAPALSPVKLAIALGLAGLGRLVRVTASRKVSLPLDIVRVDVDTVASSAKELCLLGRSHVKGQ